MTRRDAFPPLFISSLGGQREGGGGGWGNVLGVGGGGMVGMLGHIIPRLGLVVQMSEARLTQEEAGSIVRAVREAGGEWRQLLIGLAENTPPVWANCVAAHRPVEFFFFFLKIG